MANLCAPWGKRIYERFPQKYPPDYHYYQRSSLPPLRKPVNKHLGEVYPCPDQGGDTSGYASDCAPQGTPDVWSRRRSTGVIWTRDAARTGSPDSVSTTTGERLRWGDRGVGVGHLWEPNEVDQRPPILPGDGSPPGWLQRGLKSDSEMMIVSHASEKESSEDTESTIGARSYLRGQNIPLDAEILAEREQKRQRAIEHQQAICQQLQEREQRRREEKERKRQQEQLEEERIKREQEQERERLFREEQKTQARIEREKKRQEAMREALENAERSALLDKQKKKYAKLGALDDSEATVTLENNNSPRQANLQGYPDIVQPLMNEQNHQYHAEEQREQKEPQINEKFNDGSVLSTPRQKEQQTTNLYKNSDSSSDSSQKSTKPFPDNLHQADGLAIVLQSTPYSTVDSNSLSSLQFALLMTPQHTSTNHQPVISQIPVAAIPLSARSNNSVATNTINTTHNRILTPTKYRQRANCKDACTQTEKVEYQVEIRPKEYKYGSLDRQTVTRHHRERRMHSEERSTSERPKWGVNKPPTQYLTQSEKDPLYQRRKLRQKLHDLKLSENEKNNNDSSDDSRSPSPVNKKSVVSRRGDKMYLQNMNVYQTEIVPIEADAKGRLYVGQKPTSTRRQSISEKFLIAKQRRDKSIDYDSSFDTRKRRLNRRNEHKRLSNDEAGSTYWESAEILSQLSNLKNNILQKQKTWESNSSPRSGSLDIDTDVI